MKTALARISASSVFSFVLVADTAPAAAQAAVPVEREVARKTDSGGEASPAPRVDFDGTESHRWWRLGSRFTVQLRDERQGDEVLQEWPQNLTQGAQTTAAIAEFRRVVGRLTLRAGVGAGVTTRTSAVVPGGEGNRRQEPAGVATVGATLALPDNWELDLGASATSTTGVTVGATARKRF